MASTPAQEEFDRIASQNSSSLVSSRRHHPADTVDYHHDRKIEEPDEETRYLQQMIEHNMRIRTFDRRPCLPHKDFDKGRTTGVKGVIADARSYEEARQNGSLGITRNRCRTADKRESVCSFLNEAGDGSDSDEGDFFETWREQRRLELQKMGKQVKNRRTSPSVRRYGFFDEVDALGYLDAIEKVTPDTVVVVFVYDPDCPASKMISETLLPIVPAYPAVHFVRVHYAEIEFDNAGVPAILAYKEQGELFANLTYVIDHIPEGALFNTHALENVLSSNKII